MNQLLGILTTFIGNARYLILGTITVLLTEVAGFNFISSHQTPQPLQTSKVLVESSNSTHSALLALASKTAAPATPSPKPSPVPSKTPTTPKPSVAASPKPSVAPAAPAPLAAAPASNRLGWPDNKFGMYSYKDPESVSLTSEMVNSNGGDWGWILFPINIKDRGSDSWNTMFSICREKHLIPVVQVIMDPNYTPSDDDIGGFSDFLNGLSWPTQKRFVTTFNEVNAAEYWGNRIAPEEVAQKLNKFIDSLKGRSPEFFVMNGALNASARTGKVHTNLGVDTEYLDETDFLVRMNNAVPGIFAKLDGWAVHTYPQPEYKGKPLDTTIAGEADWERGRNTMSSYKWELNILKTKFGVDRPVFITEMGWPHAEGAKPRPEWYNQSIVADYYKSVFKDLLMPDSRVVAVFPFGIKVPGLDNFSFVGPDGYHYPQFDALKSLPKVAGNPPR